MADGNYSLYKARSAKNDEFYTQLKDIENELRYYRRHFNGKSVLCNCDDPYESNFFRFFVLNFKDLGLKSLICTSYAASTLAGTVYPMKVPYVARVTCIEDMTGDNAFGPDDVSHIFELEGNTIEPLEGDGDFRSRECVDLLDECDIVCTNPPFSLFREYMAQLMEHKKDFLVVGNINAVKYREIFPMLKNDEVWMGATRFEGGAAYFIADPSRYDPVKMSNPKNAYMKDGKFYWRVNGVRWFTNIDNVSRHEGVSLFRHYDPDVYPSYANFDGIDVGKVKDIPCDYAGSMGVPISFMDKYDPDQFEIVGLGHGNLGVDMGIRPYDRTLKSINKGLRDGDLFYMRDGYPYVPYTRIVIKNKHPEASANENNA